MKFYAVKGVWRLRLIHPTNYLQQEVVSSVRHEYVAGHLFAMAGGSTRHNQIAVNLVSAIRPHLRGSPYRVYMSDMKVAVSAHQAFYYPDVVISCEAANKDARQYCLNEPCVLIEVLSPSTEHVDKREKLLAYQSIPSLKTYLIISQELRRVEKYWRGEQGDWYLDTYTEQGEINLEGMAFDMSLDSIYEEVF